jgi:hypothetical protein
MTTKTIPCLIISGIAFIFVPQSPAQGTFVSNIGATSVGNVAVGSDSWLAQSFLTGTNVGGYSINSVQVLMGTAGGNPNGFAISIFSASSSPLQLPQNNLGNLLGPAPLTSGVYSYSASSLNLSPSTVYYVVATAASQVALGTYNWSATHDPALQNGGWSVGSYGVSLDGQSWTPTRVNALQFAINATAIPEPSSLALLGLGGLCLASGPKRRRQLSLRLFTHQQHE